MLDVGRGVCSWPLSDLLSVAWHVCLLGEDQTSLVAAVTSAFDPKQTSIVCQECRVLLMLMRRRHRDGALEPICIGPVDIAGATVRLFNV